MGNIIGIDEERVFMRDFWNFRKKYYDPKDDNEYWSNLIDEANALGAKYNSKYLNALIIVCIDDIESRYSKSSYDHKVNTLEKTYERLRKKLQQV